MVYIAIINLSTWEVILILWIIVSLYIIPVMQYEQMVADDVQCCDDSFNFLQLFPKKKIGK